MSESIFRDLKEEKLTNKSEREQNVMEAKRQGSLNI